MLVDFRTADDIAATDADICVVGAGAAGLAIAVSLIGTRCRVCVLESGGLAFEAESRALYEGETLGVPWVTGLATSRSRVFGGTTDQWAGGCTALDEMDFCERPWVPYSGWPITRSDLDPWYSRARPILLLKDTPLDAGGPVDRDPPTLSFDPDKFLHHAIMRSRMPRLGEAHRAALARADNVRVLLHANVVDLTANENASAVSAARIRTLDGKSGWVRARSFVLACGGIENARLLLLSNSVARQGLGNGHDLVGRFFMDHPSATLGRIATDAPARLGDPYNRQVILPGVPRPGEISLSPQIQAKKRLLNARLRPQDYENEEAIPDGVMAFREFRAGLRDGAFPNPLPNLARRMICGFAPIVSAVGRRLRGRPVVPSHRLDLEGFFEQAPNPDSRVSLADTLDPLGQRRVRLDWRLTELDRRTYRMAAVVFGGELARLGLGELKLDPWLRPDADGDPRLCGMAHHLGTTRMSDDPLAGVVDRNCRVHGIANLYVVGGSVFATGGWALPTFTIVALALRLANHLRRRLTESGPVSLRAVGTEPITRAVAD